MSFTTVSSTGSGTAHGWQAGWLRTLCGVAVKGLQATGAVWPSVDGHMGEACYQAQRNRGNRPPPIRVVAWLDPSERPCLRSSGNPDAVVSRSDMLAAGPPERIGPGLHQLWSRRTTAHS